MKNIYYDITVINFEKHQQKLKKGHKAILVSTGFLSDPKIRLLNPATKLLFLSCMLVAGESTSSQISVSHDSLCFQSGVKSGSLQSQLDLLQSLQLLTYEKNEFLYNRIEKNRKEKNRIEGTEVSETSKNPEIGLPEILPSRPNKVKPRGCIMEFNFDSTSQKMLENVTESLQRAWLTAYPNAQWICHEIRKAAAWCEANPKKKPKDFGRFMNTWLSNGFEQYRKSLNSNAQNKIAQGNDEIRRKIESGEL